MARNVSALHRQADCACWKNRTGVPTWNTTGAASGAGTARLPVCALLFGLCGRLASEGSCGEAAHRSGKEFTRHEPTGYADGWRGIGGIYGVARTPANHAANRRFTWNNCMRMGREKQTKNDRFAALLFVIGEIGDLLRPFGKFSHNSGMPRIFSREGPYSMMRRGRSEYTKATPTTGGIV